MVRIYLFTIGGEIVWTTNRDTFSEKLSDKNYNYCGYIDSDKNGGCLSGGPDIRPFNGKNMD